jgi:cytochrome c oxidase cbb3-type subunit 4
MDINDLRSMFTVLTLVLFVGIVWWAYSSHRKQAFDEAALLPFDDDASVSAGKTSHAE